MGARRHLGRRARRPVRAQTLTEPLSNRIFLAGEATHETLWGTVNGAWESGERAGNAVVKLLGGPSKRG